MKNKTKSFLVSILAVFTISFTAFGFSAFASTSKLSDGIFKFGAPTLTLQDKEDGVVFSGTMGAGRAGFVLNEEINIGEELNFYFSTLVDSGDELAQGNPQNRAYVITLNEYKNGVNEADATHLAPVNGWQLEVRTDWALNVVIDTMSHGDREGDFTNTVLTKQEYPYFCSALWQKEVEGVTADKKIRVTAYLSDEEGNKADRRSFTHYFAKLESFDLNGEVKEVVTTFLKRETMLKDTPDFENQLKLGAFIINENSVIKTINVDFGIYSLQNGKTSKMIVENNQIKGLKTGESIQVTPTLIAREENVYVGDITFEYYSLDESILTVDNQGNITAVASAGRGYVDIYSSNGHWVRVSVTIFDDKKPEIEFVEEQIFAEIYEQYETITLSNFTATDESGVVEKELNVISPYYYDFDCSLEVDEFELELTEVGNYIIEYKATDIAGNVEIKNITFTVNKNEEVTNWTKYGTYNAYSKLSALQNGAVNFTGEVNSRVYGDVQKAGLYYNNGLVFNKLEDGSYTTVEFSFLVDYKAGNPLVEDATDQSRYLFFSFVEGSSSDQMGDGRIGWNMPGIMLSMGQRHYCNGDINASNLIWYELRAGMNQLSRQHTSVIDAGANATPEEKQNAKIQRDGAYSGGLKYLPWFEDGDAVSWAKKFNTGKEIKVKIEYFDKNSPGWESKWKENYYVLSMDKMQFRIPADMIANDDNGFRRQAYIGFEYYVTNGKMPFELSISKIVNGDISEIEFNQEQNALYDVGESFKLGVLSKGNNNEYVSDTYTFASLNPKVATVDSEGNVKIVGVGSALIKVLSNKSNKVAVYSLGVGIEKLNIIKDEFELYLDEDGTLDIETVPDLDIPLKYTSSNSRIVAALSDGTLQAVGEGEVEITASYLNWSDTCKVKVLPARERQSLPPESQPSKAGCKGAIASPTVLSIAFVCAIIFIAKRKVNREGKQR